MGSSRQELATPVDPDQEAAAEQAARRPARPNPSSDRLTRLAARLLGTPAAALTAISHDREEVLSGYRLAEIGWCDRALAGDGPGARIVRSDGPITVADAHEGWRWDSNLTSLDQVRSLLGVPLRDATERVVGALYVLDTAPRSWTSAQLVTLEEVAAALPDRVDRCQIRTAEARIDLDALAIPERMSEALLAVDHSGTLVAWNAAAETMFGWKATEALGRPIDQLALPDSAQDADNPLSCLLDRAADAPGPHKIRLRHRDGRPISASARAWPIDRGAGPATLFLLRDGSSEEPDLSPAFLSALVDTLDVGVVACDEHGNIVLYNQAMRRLRGLPETWSPSDWSVRDLVKVGSELFHPDGTPMTLAQTPLLRAWRGESLQHAEVLVRSSDHRTRIMAANAKQIVSGIGQRLGAVAAYHDVTDERRRNAFSRCELQVGRALTHAHSTRDAGPAVLKALATTLDWPHAELWLTDQSGKGLVPVAHWTADTVGAQLHLPDRITDNSGIVGEVWSTGRPLWAPDLTDSVHRTNGQAAARTDE